MKNFVFKTETYISKLYCFKIANIESKWLAGTRSYYQIDNF